MIAALPKQKIAFQKALLSWYDAHQRALPWRAVAPATPDPYHVWLSEIMLQQTVVAAVIPYFKNFLTRWPRLSDLAKASRDEVLHAWQGLGYYRRAHLLHDCAQSLVKNYDGQWPEDEAGLLALPGIGPYTAAAIAAIAFDQKANVVDGNIERIMARLFLYKKPLAEIKKDLKKEAAHLLPAKRHGDYAQALMDLGAMICRPQNPQCMICPVQKFCGAFEKNFQNKIPAAKIRKAKPQKYAYVFWLENQKGDILLMKREGKKLLAGLTMLPTSPWQDQKESVTAAQKSIPLATHNQDLGLVVRHSFTHFDLHLHLIKAKGKGKAPENYFWESQDDFIRHAWPSLMRKVIKAYDQIAAESSDSSAASGL